MRKTLLFSFLLAIIFAIFLAATLLLIPRCSTDIQGDTQTLEEWDQWCLKNSERLKMQNRLGPHFTTIVGISSQRTASVETPDDYYQAIRREPGRINTFYQMTDSETTDVVTKIRLLFEETKKIDISFAYTNRESVSIIIDTETRKRLSDSFSLTSPLTIKFPVDLVFAMGEKIYSLEGSNLKFVLEQGKDAERILFFTSKSFQTATAIVDQGFVDCLLSACENDGQNGNVENLSRNKAN